MEVFPRRNWKCSWIWFILIGGPFFRELFGSGKLMGVQVIPDAVYAMGYENNGLMLLSPMALITVGIFIWIQRLVTVNSSKKLNHGSIR